MAIGRETMTEALHARRSEARFQTLVQNASDVILIARPDTTITYQTPSANRILGYADGSLEGRRFTALLPPRRRRAGIGRIQRRGVSTRNIGHGKMADPTLRPVHGAMSR